MVSIFVEVCDLRLNS